MRLFFGVLTSRWPPVAGLCHLDTTLPTNLVRKNRKKSKMSLENDEQLFEGLDDSAFQDFDPERMMHGTYDRAPA
jgi:hypothetical protein